MNVDVQCQEVVSEAKGKQAKVKVCGTSYTTSKAAWQKGLCRCPQCGGRKARLVQKGETAR